jgi:hypothetical protein
MFQVLSGDGWASDIARPLFTKKEAHGIVSYATDTSVAFYFVSYILINSIMMLNVVVAVLLVICNVCCTFDFIFTCICMRAKG